MGDRRRLTLGSLQAVQQLRTIRVIAAAFGSSVIVLAAVMLAISSSWDSSFDTIAFGVPDSDDVGRLGVVIAGALGLAGLVAALTWRNYVSGRPHTGPAALGTFIGATAISESGMLAGMVFSILAQALVPFWLGATLFIASLVVMATAVGQIEIDGA